MKDLAAASHDGSAPWFDEKWRRGSTALACLPCLFVRFSVAEQVRARNRSWNGVWDKGRESLWGGGGRHREVHLIPCPPRIGVCVVCVGCSTWVAWQPCAAQHNAAHERTNQALGWAVGGGKEASRGERGTRQAKGMEGEFKIGAGWGFLYCKSCYSLCTPMLALHACLL